MHRSHLVSLLFFFTDTATTEIYTLSLHDALPILRLRIGSRCSIAVRMPRMMSTGVGGHPGTAMSTGMTLATRPQDRKSTRLNSSHMSISYAVFCLKKKKKKRPYMEIRRGGRCGTQ